MYFLWILFATLALAINPPPYDYDFYKQLLSVCHQTLAKEFKGQGHERSKSYLLASIESLLKVEIVSLDQFSEYSSNVWFLAELVFIDEKTLVTVVNNTVLIVSTLKNIVSNQSKQQSKTPKPDKESVKYNKEIQIHRQKLVKQTIELGKHYTLYLHHKSLNTRHLQQNAQSKSLYLYHKAQANSLISLILEYMKKNNLDFKFVNQGMFGLGIDGSGGKKGLCNATLFLVGHNLINLVKAVDEGRNANQVMQVRISVKKAVSMAIELANKYQIKL